jgi:hypothetical protein
LQSVEDSHYQIFQHQDTGQEARSHCLAGERAGAELQAGHFPPVGICPDRVHGRALYGARHLPVPLPLPPTVVVPPGLKTFVIKVTAFRYKPLIAMQSSPYRKPFSKKVGR